MSQIDWLKGENWFYKKIQVSGKKNLESFGILNNFFVLLLRPNKISRLSNCVSLLYLINKCQSSSGTSFWRFSGICGCFIGVILKDSVNFGDSIPTRNLYALLHSLSQVPLFRPLFTLSALPFEKTNHHFCKCLNMSRLRCTRIVTKVHVESDMSMSTAENTWTQTCH